MNHRLVILILMLGCIPFSAGTAQVTGSEDETPQPFKVATVPYTIAPLDKVLVKSSGDEVDSLQVTQDGLIPLGDKSYQAQGLSTDELIHLVRAHLPDARSVTIEEFRANRVTVLGEVFHQIFTEMSDGPMRVLDAIASANGFTPLANTRRVKLVRENAGRVEVYELDLREVMRGQKSNQNMILKAGDVITVPRNFL